MFLYSDLGANKTNNSGTANPPPPKTGLQAGASPQEVCVGVWVSRKKAAHLQFSRQAFLLSLTLRVHLSLPKEGNLKKQKQMKATEWGNPEDISSPSPHPRHLSSAGVDGMLNPDSLKAGWFCSAE